MAHPVPETYTYHTGNDEITYGDGFTFSGYDGDGNPSTVQTPMSATWTFAYDENSRVTQVSRGAGGTTTYKYDGDGRRIERIVNGAATRYVYDGSTAVEELNGANQSQLYRLAGIGFVKNGAQYYSEENAQGSSVATLDSSGAQMDGTEYDAYGLVWRQELSWGTPHSDYRWVGSKGYVTDDDTGMDLLGDRYYLPATGRFLTADPIGHGGGLNLYEYCDDNPLTRFDPTGHYEVRLGWHSVGFGLYHSFVLLTDNVKGSPTYGWQWAYSAGPERTGLDSLTNPGQVIDESGVYSTYHYDSKRYWDVESSVLSTNSAPIGPLLNALADVREARSKANWQYELLPTNGYNSNSFAHMILDAINVYYPKDPSLRKANALLSHLRKRQQMSFPGWERWKE